MRARTCAYQGVKNFSFSESFAYILNKWHLGILRCCSILKEYTYFSKGNNNHFFAGLITTAVKRLFFGKMVPNSFSVPFCNLLIWRIAIVRSSHLVALWKTKELEKVHDYVKLLCLVGGHLVRSNVSRSELYEEHKS